MAQLGKSPEQSETTMRTNTFESLIFYLFSTIVAVALVQATTDYCKKDLCGDSTHIACHNNNRFSSNCPSDAQMVDITPSLQQLVVEQLNEKRNFIAGGGERKLKPACRMATMQWDAELAKLAELNVKQCKGKHDPCHNTDTFKLSGQNLAWFESSGTHNHADNLNSSVQMWYNEIKNSNMEMMKEFKGENAQAIGHFSVIMNERNTHVGCAASHYRSEDGTANDYLVACNFAYTNILTKEIYSSCPSPATECKTGKNPKYANLCSTSEFFDVNGY